MMNSIDDHSVVGSATMKTPVILFSFLLIGTAIAYDRTALIRKMRDPDRSSLLDIVTTAGALKESTITKANLGHNNLGEEEIKLLAKALKNSPITSLILLGNNMGKGGAVALANVLKYTNITDLDLGRNGIGDEGASAIAKVLRDTRITRLDLRHNNIGDEGAKAIATGLIGSRVNVVYLHDNRFRDVGAKAIADSLNKTLITELYLDYNPVGARGKQAIVMSRKWLRIDRLYRHLNNFLTSRNGSLEFNIEGALTNKSDYIEFVRLIASNKPVYRLLFTTEGRTKFTANQIEDFVDNIESRLEDCFRKSDCAVELLKIDYAHSNITEDYRKKQVRDFVDNIESRLEDCFRKSDLVVKGFRDFLATTRNGSLEFRIDYAHSNKSDYIEFAGLIARCKSFYRGGSITEDYGREQVRDFVDNIESRVEKCLRESELMYQQLESFLVTKDESLEFYINYTIPRKFEYLNFTIVILKDEQGWMNYFISKGTRENWSYLVKDFFQNIHQRLIEFFGRIHQK